MEIKIWRNERNPAWSIRNPFIPVRMHIHELHMYTHTRTCSFTQVKLGYVICLEHTKKANHADMENIYKEILDQDPGDTGTV